MKSQIFTGTINHRRYRPVAHKLCYPVYLYAFDIDDFSGLNQRYPLFGYNKSAVTSIHDKDYLKPGNIPIKDKLLELLRCHRIKQSISQIIMITSARYFNYVFNPVNFYYCYAADDTLEAIIAEVNNTYKERHPYVLKVNKPESGKWMATSQTPKVFHVSPFNKVEGIYHFYFSNPKETLEIKIELFNNNKKILAAEFKGSGEPMTPVNHIKTIMAYPFAPHLSIPRIYTHALKLYFKKKLTFNDKPIPQSPMTMRKQKPDIIEALCQKLVFKALRKISIGGFKLKMPNQEIVNFGHPGDCQPVVMEIRDYNFFSRIIVDGEIGFGEAYMHAEWDTPELLELLKILIRNRDHFSDGNLLFSFLSRIQEKTAHDSRKNSIKNAPENIRAHYDLSNAFYELFLDHTMLYSCALFQNPGDSLEKAQTHKMMRILTQADIRDTHHILEIGCGWGGFAIFAARRTGCHVTGITISKAQYEMACQRVRQEGLEDRITIKLQDYRHITGKFDRIVSLEMIEAVGPHFLPTYFKQVQTLLNPDGRMVFQSITIEDERYAAYCKSRDWIQKHIFPGGHLPCLKVLKNTISKHTGFHILDIHHMGNHYATTLSHWRDRFVLNKNKIIKLGFDETFRRKWLYYFAICEAGFSVGGIDDIQVTLTL